MLPSMRYLLPVVCVLLLCPRAARAQFDTGSIVGTVRDSSGATVGDAKVTLTSTTTGISTTKISAADGNYEFPATKPGVYIVAAEKAGISTRARRQRSAPGGRAAQG